ncbi:polysaccharide deacetylase family protein [Paenibacillus pini]|uniref:Peptidoglycan N-acetylglucosamine deacetylase n=1 Tax=Paenibacillus pini JCM 16418 TaxID=1236976 RepID=W7YI89_9BACL|nr:polysaccharide deacetylase family protein [Paenibacillus pini]GAF07333.1 peptidoglycan N-acetylglucosamine deacetylase [Paenibacillus pini JCM 16418]
MNRRKKTWWPFWLVGFIILTGVIVVINLMMQNVASGNQSTSENVDVSPSAYPGFNIETRTNDTKNYILSISSVIANSKEINAPIQKWINDQERDFLVQVKDSANTIKNDRRAELNITLETNKNNDHLYSLVFTSYQITGGANGQSVIKTFNIDTAKNKILNLSDFMTVDKEAVAHIIPIVQEELKKQKTVHPYIFEEDLQKSLQNPAAWNWSIGKGVFTLYFNKYEIAAGAAGTVQVNIPLDSLQSYMKKDLHLTWNNATTNNNESKVKKPKIHPLDPKGKYVALTFDDGPHPKVTPRVLRTLKEFNIKATFFMLGVQVEYYPDVAKKVAEAGHEIGNHSKSHPNLAKMSMSEIRKQIIKSSDQIEAATGEKPTLFRPPYGAINDAIKKITKEQKTPIILWSVDSLDWKSRNAQAVNAEDETHQTRLDCTYA